MSSIINQEISMMEFIPLNIVPRNGSIKNLDVYENQNQLLLKSKRCNDIIINKNLKFDKNDFLAIGLYLAEGDKFVNLDRRYHHSGEVAFVNNEIRCLNLIINLLEKLDISRDQLKWRIGLNIKHELNEKELIDYWMDSLKLKLENGRPKYIYRTGNYKTKLNDYSSSQGCFHISHSSVIFRNVFLNFICKIFNFCIENKLKKELALILQGFFAGDGNVDYSPKFNRKQVEFTCHDLELLERIRTSLRILGLKSIKETWPERTKTHSKALRIYNKHDFDILNRYKIPYLVDYKRERFLKIINSY